jgi:glycosyltransferase involved in cell wall biosynthesis
MDPPPATTVRALARAPEGTRPLVFCIDSPGLGGAEINLMRVISMIGAHRVALLHGDGPHSEIAGFAARFAIPCARVAYSTGLPGAPRGLIAALRAIRVHARARFVIWTHHPDTCRWLQLALAALRRPYVIVEQLVPTDPAAFRHSKLSIPLKRFAVRHAATVVLNATSQIQPYASVFGLDPRRMITISSSRNVLAIRSAVETLRRDRPALRRSLGLPCDAPVVLCVARLHPQKDQSTLIRALASDTLSQLRAFLVFVGDGPDRAALEREAKTSLQGRVLFAGHQPEPFRWLAAADVFTLVSHSEGLPGALIEALAAGLPSVATDIAGNSELVIHRKTGLLVPRSDPAAVSAAIAELVESRELASQVSRAGVLHVRALYDEVTERERWTRLLLKSGAEQDRAFVAGE